MTRTSGSRTTFGTFAQNISEATQQHSSSARSRRASVVTELQESTSEKLQTRVVANYNHMHALSVCYYEVVQLYRSVLRPTHWDKVLFIPIAPLDFTDDDVLDRFREILASVALDEVVASVLATGSPKIALISALAGVRYGRIVPRRSRFFGGNQEGRRLAIQLAGFAVDIPGPLTTALAARFSWIEARSAGLRRLGPQGWPLERPH